MKFGEIEFKLPSKIKTSTGVCDQNFIFRRTYCGLLKVGMIIDNLDNNDISE
jgi:hypothetical protein